MAKAELTAERLRDLLKYDPDTGEFVWKVDRNHLAKAGDIAGYIDQRQGYRKVMVLGREYAAHRLAFLYMTGAWPVADVDHINGITDDNRFANLRDVTTAENIQNQKRARSDSTSGLLGAKRAQGKWQAAITANGKYIHLGTFETAEEAHLAYIEGKRRFHRTNTL